jgi:hypothetical protein
MDLYWPGRVIIEMKSPSEAKRLQKHRAQASDYWENISLDENNVESPDYLGLCAFTEFEI